MADALKSLTEAVMSATSTQLNDSARREGVELLASMSEEMNKRPDERRHTVLRAIGTTFRSLAGNVDKVAAAYELLKAAARSQGVDLTMTRVGTLAGTFWPTTRRKSATQAIWASMITTEDAARLWHPWPRIERLTWALIADRLTRGPSETTDRALAAIIAERERIERAGWFN